MQQENSVFLEVILLVVVRKKNSYEYVLILVRERERERERERGREREREKFCLWGWMKSEVYKRKVATPHELFASIWMLLSAYET
jgi:hypothetical protein